MPFYGDEDQEHEDTDTPNDNAEFWNMPHTIEDVTCDKETEKAILCVLDDGSTLWVPKSQIHDDSEVYKPGTDGDLIVSDWWAQQAKLV